jgi:hypothetical protein
VTFRGRRVNMRLHEFKFSKTKRQSSSPRKSGK